MKGDENALVAYTRGSVDHFADYLAKLGRSSESAQVIRCPYCGHKKERWDMLCEACHRYPH